MQRLQKHTFQKTGQPDQKPDFGVRDIKVGHKLMQNEIGQYFLRKMDIRGRFMGKPEAGHFLSGKIFAP